MQIRFDPSGLDVIAFACSERQAGRPCVIATLVGIDGTSPRPLGAQMAIAEDGRFVGTISSGCLERAIIEEAQSVMQEEAGRTIRYGKDSRFLDIVLPCGSGVDILYTTNLSPEILLDAVESVDARNSFSLHFSEGGFDPEKSGKSYCREYKPKLKIMAAGVGAELSTFVSVSVAAGAEVICLSQEEATLAECSGAEKLQLISTSRLPELNIDPWTAFVFLFHDREWELALAPTVLTSGAFYIGAVGSRRTQADRLDRLSMTGIDNHFLTRLRGPIGVIPATRDPASLAVSVLAEILTTWGEVHH